MSIFSSSTEVADREAKHKIYGVVIGIVTQNNDTEKHTYRVKVRFPWLPHSSKDGFDEESFDNSAWARIASFMAGDYIGDTQQDLGQRGAFFMPEKGDEVLIAFEHGDIARPIVIGRLWSDVKHDTASNGEVKPNRPVYSHSEAKGTLAIPVDGGKDDGAAHAKTDHAAGGNDLSGIRTRSGHALVFNDNACGGVYLRTAKNHRIEMVDGDDQGILLADAKGNYVWLKSGKQGGDIEIHTEGNIKLTAKKDIVLEAEGSIKQTSTKAKIEMTAKQSYTLKAAGITIDSSASGTIHASKGLKITGHPINLN